MLQPDLAGELRSLYRDFLQALEGGDLEKLLGLVDIRRTDEEVLRAEEEKDGFVSYSRWLLTTYPTLEQASFFTLKTKGRDLAGCYLGWKPPYSDQYLVLTLIRYLRISGTWKLVFRLTEMASAPFRVLEGEDPLKKALEVLETNPLMVLKRPEPTDKPRKAAREPTLSKRQAGMKGEMDKVLAAVYSALQNGDVEGFLAAVVVSQEHETTLRKKPRRLLREILKNTPRPSIATFVDLKSMGDRIAGYYFVAPNPTNPAFSFVYLSPFLRSGGEWKLAFSLEYAPAMNLIVSKSKGDAVSRAREVIREFPILHMDFVMPNWFAEAASDFL